MKPKPLILACPECGQHIEVPLVLTPQGLDEDGNYQVTVEGDTADLWAHAWTHQTEATS